MECGRVEVVLGIVVDFVVILDMGGVDSVVTLDIIETFVAVDFGLLVVVVEFVGLVVVALLNMIDVGVVACG